MNLHNKSIARANSLDRIINQEPSMLNSLYGDFPEYSAFCMSELISSGS